MNVPGLFGMVCLMLVSAYNRCFFGYNTCTIHMLHLCVSLIKARRAITC